MAKREEAPAIPSRGSPSRRPSEPTAQARGARSGESCAYSTRASVTFMKKRSVRPPLRRGVGARGIGHDARVVRSVPCVPSAGVNVSEAARPAIGSPASAPTSETVSHRPAGRRWRWPPPPNAAGRRRQRIEHTVVCLPAHGLQRRPSERQVSRCAPRRPPGNCAINAEDAPPDRRAWRATRAQPGRECAGVVRSPRTSSHRDRDPMRPAREARPWPTEAGPVRRRCRHFDREMG